MPPIAPLLAATPDVSRYNVVWNSPSKDPSGVMPVGNGDIAAGVYAIENGDLFLLLAKNDAYTYQGDLFKTGRVRVSLTPNPFQSGKPFRQTLDLPTGSIRIDSDGTKLRIWADANRPVFHLEIESSREIDVAAKPEFWKRFDHCSFNVANGYEAPFGQPVQDAKLERNGRLLWYFAVGDRSIFPDDLKFYGIEHEAEKFADPFRFNTFGNLLECSDLKPKDGALSGKGRKFDLRIHALTLQTPEPRNWIDAIERQAAQPPRSVAIWLSSVARRFEISWARRSR